MRMQQAIAAVIEQQLAIPVVIEDYPGRPVSCELLCSRADWAELMHQAALQLQRLNPVKKWSVEQASQMAEEPLLLGALLTSLGVVDGAVAGAVATTPDVIRAGLRGVGLAANSGLVSSSFLMQHPNWVMSFGDCGVNPDPNSDQLAQIAIDTARSHQLLTGQTPKIALLSFSTLGSASHPSVDKVREATALVKTMAAAIDPAWQVSGEVQADVALVATVAALKAPNEAIAGDANVLIFPDLSAGNIGYKLVERLAGATAVGPLLQGFSSPWLDLSRGCCSDDIVAATTIAAVFANQ